MLNENIYLISERRSSAAILTKELEERGYKVDSAFSAEDVIRLFIRGPKPKAVIIDPCIISRKRSKFYNPLTATLSVLYKYPDCNVIFNSDRMEYTNLAKQIGAKIALKPVSIDQLVSLLEEK